MPAVGGRGGFRGRVRVYRGGKRITKALLSINFGGRAIFSFSVKELAVCRLLYLRNSGATRYNMGIRNRTNGDFRFRLTFMNYR